MLKNMGYKRACLITPGHVSSTPRLVKEANALVQENYRVTVVAGDYMAALRNFDQELAENGQWRLIRVKPAKSSLKIFQAAQQHLAGCLQPLAPNSLTLAVAAHNRISQALARAAAAEPADIYIAHCLAALPAAFKAAKTNGAKLGFDAEDFHVGELSESQTRLRSIRSSIERQLLPYCAHFTAAAPLIAEAYKRSYGLHPKVVLNVFPRSEMQPASARQQLSPSLYWFSQTIGAGRGLEAAIEAISLSRSKPHLFLRGFISDSYRIRLDTIASALRIENKIHILPPAHPQLMPKLAAEYDAGLSLEQTNPENRNICLTNKIFCYMSAGIPVILTPSAGQSALAPELAEACVVTSSYTSSALADAYDELLCDSTRFAAAGNAACKAARERFNWEHEKLIFIESVKRACAS